MKSARKFLSLVLCTVMLLQALPLNVHAVPSDVIPAAENPAADPAAPASGDYRPAPDAAYSLHWETQSDGTLQITSYTGQLPVDFVLPDAIEGKTVTCISPNAFSYCDSMETVQFPSELQSIGQDAFYRCTSLSTVNFPSALQSIGETAFSRCKNLTSVNFPDSLTTIGNRAFNYCSKLQKINYPIGLVNAGYNIFSYCPLLTHVDIPEGVTDVGTFLRECSSLKTVHLPSTLMEIGWYAFSGCTNLTDINFPDGMTSIGMGAFENCTSLTQLHFPDSLLDIGDSAFENCSALQTVRYPAGLRNTGTNIFANCPLLTHVDIPEGVTAITGLFNGCSSLKAVSFPSTLVQIYHYAFQNCSALEQVQFPNSLQRIWDGAFENCSSLTQLHFPDSLYAIDSLAFEGCSQLKIINYPMGLIYAGPSIFAGCPLLTHVDIPEGITTVGNLLDGCSSLKTVSFPSTLTEIQPYAFLNCTSLDQLEFPDSLQHIKDRAFSGCTNLSAVNFPSALQDIGEEAFFECTHLNDIHFSDGLKSIGSQAFRNCNSLIQLHFPDSLQAIGGYAFENCSNLQFVHYPIGLTAAGSYSGTKIFGNCPLLTHAEIPEGVTTVVSNIFNGCSGLKVVNFPSTLTEIQSYAFQNCTGLENLTIGKAVTTIADSAFGGCTNLTIQCYSNSAAHHYAEAQQIPYLLLDDHVHEFTMDSETAPTCTVDGKRHFVCTICGYEYTEVLPAIGHDFADWVITTPATYQSEGVRTRVCRNCGKQETEKIPVLVLDPDNPNYGMANFTVVNAQSLTPLAGAYIRIVSADGTEDQTFAADGNGKIRIVLPVGVNTVSCYANGCVTRNLTVRIKPGENEIPQIGMSSLPAYEATIQSHLMTEEEIVHANIDLQDVGNQQVYEYELKLSFTPTLEIYSLKTIKTESGKVLKGSGSGGAVWIERENAFWVPAAGGTNPTGGVKVIPITEYFYLIIRGEIRWQKEMFDVEMLIVNNSNTDTMENLTAELQIPEGLSLAATTTVPQKQLQEIPSIAGGESKSVHWFLRGDKAGSYGLSAHLKGMLMPFEEPIDEVYISSNQLQVWAGDALHLDFEFPGATYYGQDYPVKISLTNVSDIPLYNITHAVQMIEGMEIYHEDQLVRKKLTEGNLAAEVPVFHPGDKLVIEGTANIFFQSEIMEQKLQRMIDVVDGAEFVYHAAGLVKAYCGDFSNFAESLSAICGSLAECDPLFDDATQETLETVKDLTEIAGNVQKLFSSNQKKNQSAEVKKALEDTDVLLELDNFAKDPMGWVNTHSEKDLKALKEKFSAIQALLEKFISEVPTPDDPGDFDLFDSLRTAISSIPVRFCLSEIIMTENPDNTASIPWTYHVSPATPFYNGVADPDKYLQSIVQATLGEAYSELVPNYAHLIPGLDDPLNQQEAIRYIQATEAEIAKVKAKDANGNIQFRAWIESAAGEIEQPLDPADFELSCDNENAVMENGVLHFQGDTTLSILPKSEQDGTLHIEDSNGNRYLYNIRVTAPHICSGSHLKTLIEPTQSRKGYAVRLCDTCGTVLEVVPLTLKDLCSVHSYGEWTTHTEASENAQGIRSRTCSVCGHTEYEFVKYVHQHQMEQIPRKAPTCTAEGVIEHWQCTVCGNHYADAEGTQELTNGAWVLPKTAHAFGPDWKSDAEHHWKECSCGQKNGMGTHSYGEWTVTKEPTTTETGLRVRSCTVCGYQESEKLPVLPPETGPTEPEEAIEVQFVRKVWNSEKKTVQILHPGESVRAPKLRGLLLRNMCWRSEVGTLSVKSGETVTYEQLRQLLDTAGQSEDVVVFRVALSSITPPEPQPEVLTVHFARTSPTGSVRVKKVKVAPGKTVKAPTVPGRQNRSCVWQSSVQDLTVQQREVLTYEQLKPLANNQNIVEFSAVHPG